MINRKAHAVWKGNGKEGKGTITTQSGVLSDQPYGFNTRFEDKPGTNPEELIAAAHSGCFTMALAFQLQEAGLAATEMSTEAVVTLEKDGAGFTITRAALKSRVQGRGDEAAIRKAAEAAKTGCPVSKLLKAEITLDLSIG